MSKLTTDDTTETTAPPTTPPAKQRRRSVHFATALCCGLLGLLLVTQVRAGDEVVGNRLETEREEDLARILSDLSAQSDRLQDEITQLRLTLLGFESSAESDNLALASLQRRLDGLRILAGTVPAEGEGVDITIDDPRRQVTQEQLVDLVQELRDAGAEAIAVDDVRLIASSAFVTRNNRLLVDGQPISFPIRIAAIGPARTIAEALEIPAGAGDTLRARPDVGVTVDVLAQLTVPARGEPQPFVFGQPVPTASPSPDQR